MTKPPTTSYRTLWLPDLLWLLALVLLATVPFWVSRLDIHIQQLFFRPGVSLPWFAETWWLWRILYTFGPWPALLTGLGALVFLVSSFYRSSLARWRRHAWLIILTLGLGPGLLVNVILKDHFGRPRPRQTTEFGGRWAYQTVFEKGLSGRGKSFPCGHSSMGYVFVAFYFVFRRRKRLAAWSLGSAAIFGTLIGLARMAAGGHFASDVLWSLILPAGIAFILYYVLLRIPQHEDAPETASWLRSRWLLVALPLVGAGMLASGLAGTPVYKEFDDRVSLDRHTTTLTLSSSRCDVDLVFDAGLTNEAIIGGSAQGFGWPWSKLRYGALLAPADNGSTLKVSFGQKGGFAELAGRMVVRLPLSACRAIRATLDHADLDVTLPAGTSLPDSEWRITEGTLDISPAARETLDATTLPGGAVVYRSKPSATPP